MFKEEDYKDFYDKARSFYAPQDFKFHYRGVDFVIKLEFYDFSYEYNFTRYEYETEMFLESYDRWPDVLPELYKNILNEAMGEDEYYLEQIFDAALEFFLAQKTTKAIAPHFTKIHEYFSLKGDFIMLEEFYVQAVGETPTFGQFYSIASSAMDQYTEELQEESEEITINGVTYRKVS